MKTINFELSNKLDPYLKNIETEYYFCNIECIKKDMKGGKPYLALAEKIREEEYNIARDGVGLFGSGGYLNQTKTLTLEEAIDFLPNFTLDKIKTEYVLYYKGKHIKGENLLELIERLLEYLLENNLINK